MRIGIPLDDATFASLPEDQQDILSAFFIEAQETFRNIDTLKKSADGARYIPPESLKDKFLAIVRFGGGEFCPVRQQMQIFAFEGEKPTIH